MRYNVGLSIVAVLVGAGCWFFGLDVIPSIVVALVVAILLFAVRAFVRPVDNYEWPPPPPTITDGDRREVAELDWALRTPRRIVEDRIVGRVRALAVSGLRRRHLDFDNPEHRVRIERLVGPQAYFILTSPDRVRMNVSTLLSVLGRIESLEKPDLPTHPQT
jgi:hypothetical protein